MIIIFIILLYGLLGSICFAFYLIGKQLRNFKNKLSRISHRMNIQDSNLHGNIINLRMDLETYKKIWKTQMRPNTHMMDAQNIRDNDA